MKNTQPQNQLRIQVLAVFAAVLVIVIALIAFMNANTDRIVAQNSQYLESSTGQTARRVGTKRGALQVAAAAKRYGRVALSMSRIWMGLHPCVPSAPHQS